MSRGKNLPAHTTVYSHEKNHFGQLDDTELLALVRDGKVDAYSELYRRHNAAANMVALRQTDNPSDAEDTVAEAFSTTLSYLNRGIGPESFFRAYLLTAVKRISHRNNMKLARVVPSENSELLDKPFEDRDNLALLFETDMVAQAYSSLPVNWQAVLWYMDVEGSKPAQVADLLGLSPNAVSAMAIRARQGLRRAYLGLYEDMAPDEVCGEFASNLALLNKKGLGLATRRALRNHSRQCKKCTALFSHLDDVQAGLRNVVFPLLAGVPFVSAGSATIQVGAASSGMSGATTSFIYNALATPARIASAAAVGMMTLALIGQGAVPSSAPQAASPPVSQELFLSDPSPPDPAPTAAPAIASVPGPTIAPLRPAEPVPVAPVLSAPLATAKVSPQQKIAPSESPEPPVVPLTPSAPAAPPLVEANSAAYATSSVVSQNIETGETVLSIDFSVMGKNPLSEARLTVTLGPGAYFSTAPQLGTGWTCTEVLQAAATVACSTKTATRNMFSFTIETKAADPALRGDITYSMQGTGFDPAAGSRPL